MQVHPPNPSPSCSAPTAAWAPPPWRPSPPQAGRCSRRHAGHRRHCRRRHAPGDRTGRHRRAGQGRRRRAGGGVRGEPAVHAVADAGAAAVPSGARRRAAAERHLHAAGQRVQLRRADAAAAERAHAAAPHHAQGPHPRGHGVRAAGARGAGPLAQRGHSRGRLLRRRQRQLDGPGDHQVAAPGQAGVPRAAAPRARLGLPARPGARFRGRGVTRRRAAGIRRPAVRGPRAHRYRAAGQPSSVPLHRWVWRRRSGFKHGGMPWAVLKLGGLVVPMWREIAEMSYLWQVPHALDGSALARAVGPLPRRRSTWRCATRCSRWAWSGSAARLRLTRFSGVAARQHVAFDVGIAQRGADRLRIVAETDMKPFRALLRGLDGRSSRGAQPRPRPRALPWHGRGRRMHAAPARTTPTAGHDDAAARSARRNVD